MTARKAMMVLAMTSFIGITECFSGSGNRTGTSGASELLIPIGARSIGLGGAVVAASTGVEAIFWNPAGAWRSGFGVTMFASSMLYIADIGVNCAAVSVDLPSIGVMTLHLKALSVGEIPVTTVQTPDGTGQTFSPQFFDVGLAYSRQLTERISVGASVILISERMADVQATGFAFNGGVLYEDFANLNGLNFGVVVRNIGPQMKFEGSGLNVIGSSTSLSRDEYLYKVDAQPFELPSIFEIGLSYRTAVGENQSVMVTSAFQNNNFSDDQYKVGAEYAFHDLLFLRGGYDYAPSELGTRENIFGACFGLGVHTTFNNVDIRFDYAMRSANIFSGNHVFSLTVGL